MEGFWVVRITLSGPESREDALRLRGIAMDALENMQAPHDFGIMSTVCRLDDDLRAMDERK